MQKRNLLIVIAALVVLIGLVALTIWALNGTRARVRASEQIDFDLSENEDTDSTHQRGGFSATGDIPSVPNSVLETSIPNIRLVTFYRAKRGEPIGGGDNSNSWSQRQQYSSYAYYESGNTRHNYYPGLDLLFGYNLLNIGHYDYTTRQLRRLFPKPVLIKSLYYPSAFPDSIRGVPVQRNYFMCSVFDEDTNRDTLLNSHDLRHFYAFDANLTKRITILPEGFSAERSDYDAGLDYMYLYAREDTSHNGEIESEEPLHIFWVDLKNPGPAVRVY